MSDPLRETRLERRRALANQDPKERSRRHLDILRQYAHDAAVHTRSAKANGKLLPNLEDVAHLWEAIEVLSEELNKKE